MKNINRCIFLIFLFSLVTLIFAGCLPEPPGRFRVETSIRLVEPEGVDVLTYKDDNIEIIFLDDVLTKISFSLQNLSDSTLKVLWENVSFIDVDGSESKIITSDIDIEDKDKEIQPTSVKSGAIDNEAVIPIENIYFGWKINPIIPTGEDAHEYHEKTISLSLPIEIEEEVHEYVFDFEIEAVEVEVEQ